jgi:transposase
LQDRKQGLLWRSVRDHRARTSLVRRAKYNPDKIDPRLADLLARKPTRVATVAMANKTARIIWAIMARGDTYRVGHRPALAS